MPTRTTPAARAEPPDARPARTLRGRRLAVARAAWAATIVPYLALLAAAAPARLRPLDELSRQAEQALPPLPPAGAGPLLVGLAVYPAGVLALETAFVLAVATIAFVLVWRHSDDWLALFVSVAFVAGGAFAAPSLDALAASQPLWRYPVHVAQSLGSACALVFFYLFPDGRFVPRWTRPLAIGWAGWMAAGLLWPAAPFLLANPGALTLPWFLVWLAWWCTPVVAQVYRYRYVSGPVQRQQAKWVLFGLAIAFGGYAALVLPRMVSPTPSQPGAARMLYILIEEPFFSSLMLWVPLFTLLAILRYRLFDIDLIIRRTLVYGTLTATLAGLYWLGVAGLQRVVGWLTGQEESAVAIVVSTLAIAALFQPLRRRLQGVIDRRFYRRKYDAARTLAAFSETLRDETDLERLSAQLLGVVEETMQPTHASLWLRPLEGQSARHEPPRPTEVP